MGASDLARLPLADLRGLAAILDQLLVRADSALAAIEKKLVDALDAEWSGRTPGALQAALGALAGQAMEGAFTEADLARCLDAARDKLVPKYVDAVAGPVREGLGGAYELGRAGVLRPLGTSIEWNLIDDHARGVLASDSLYWVGTAWDRQLGAGIADTIRERVIEEGLGREEGARELERVFGADFPERSLNYWRVVSAAGTVRSRSFGAIESFVQADAETYRWLAIDDARTCATCRDLNGRVFRVTAAVERRDRFLASESPEDAKAVLPWAKESDVVGKGTDELEAAGFLSPPIHGLDRCVLVVDSFRGESRARR